MSSKHLIQPLRNPSHFVLYTSWHSQPSINPRMVNKKQKIPGQWRGRRKDRNQQGYLKVEIWSPLPSKEKSPHTQSAITVEMLLKALVIVSYVRKQWCSSSRKEREYSKGKEERKGNSQSQTIVRFSTPLGPVYLFLRSQLGRFFQRPDTK